VAAGAVPVKSTVAVVSVAAVEIVSVSAVTVLSLPAGDGEAVRSPGTRVPTTVGVPSSAAQAAVNRTMANTPNKNKREIFFICFLLYEYEQTRMIRIGNYPISFT
jgi:hypothetical protein